MACSHVHFYVLSQVLHPGHLGTSTALGCIPQGPHYSKNRHLCNVCPHSHQTPMLPTCLPLSLFSLGLYSISAKHAILCHNSLDSPPICSWNHSSWNIPSAIFTTATSYASPGTASLILVYSICLLCFSDLSQVDTYYHHPSVLLASSSISQWSTG